MNYEVKEEKFSVSIALPRDIYSRASFSFTKGLDETKVLPGLSAKGGFNFEYSKEDKMDICNRGRSPDQCFSREDTNHGQFR